MNCDSLLERIDAGRQGKNQGASMGMPKLESVINGVMRGVYTVLFSTTGTGKSSFALYSYVYKPLQEHFNDDNYKVIYYSLEMEADELEAKLLAIYIFEKYGIEISSQEIFSRSKGYILSDEYYEIVKECITEWLDVIKSKEKLIIYDKPLCAESLYASLSAELDKEGSSEETKTRIIYTPNNPDKTVVVIIDHLSLVNSIKGRSKKEEMDLVSSYLITFRNRCKISPVVIMQANRNSSSMERRKEKMNNLTIIDTKDSGNPTQDAEIVLALFDPNQEQIKHYKDYNIEILGSNFRSITVLKNRYGDRQIEIGCAFYGKVGLFAEIPKPSEINDYSKYTNSNWLLENDIDKIKKELKDEKENLNNFNFNL